MNKSESRSILHPSGFKPLALAIALLFGGITVAYAQIQADPNAAGNKRPVIDNTANGLPLIQIATPNAAGVSHNQYRQFNVDRNGAILNNAAGNANTRLGGWVGGNPNLPNGGARIILNEVTSTNPSVLRGYLEVAGQRADVVVSNRNGILVDGAGFINTARGVITTGAPVFGSNGSLDGLRVTQGAIEVGRGGFNDQATAQVDLIARSLKVNGELYANRLNVIAGANQVDYADLGVQVVQGAGDVPTVAIDIAALGGMFANGIRLIGTEGGVGVKSYGKMASAAGDFSIDAAGKIILGADTSAAGALHIASGDSIVNQARVSSDGNMDLQAANAIDNHGRQLLSGGNLSMRSATLDNSGGAVRSNRNASLSLRSNYTNAQGDTITTLGDLAIDTTGDFVNRNDLSSGGNLGVHAANINNAADGLFSAGQTALLNADQAIVNTGRVYGQDVAVAAQSIANDHEGTYGDGTPAGVMAARNTLNVGARTIVNRERALLKSDGDMAIGGALDANNNATGTATGIVNSSATIDSGGKLAIASATLTNTNAHFATEIRQDDSKTRNWTEYLVDGRPTMYSSAEAFVDPNDADQKLIIRSTGEGVEDYTIRAINETTSRTVVTQTAPAQILARGDMRFTGGTVTNDKSAIVAGGNLSGQIDGASNGGTNPQGETIVRQKITSTHHTVESCGATGSKHCNHNDTSTLNRTLPTTHFDLGIWKALAHTPPDSVANPSSAPDMAKVPDNLLYRPVTAPGLTYVIETDPAFINLRSFLSSDYLLGRMGMNPQTAQKRLGDGYYEQQLINDQILQLTGRKTLGAYASDEDQFKALMDAGVAYARQFQLLPGMTLSAAQMAALTTDIVWLVEQSMTLPDGTTQKVLAPVVYLSQLHADDLQPTGAVISAENIDLMINGTLDNAGTLKANGNLLVNAAQDINNTLGTLTSNSQNGNILLQAGRDLNNQSGAISGNRVGMLAGRDLNAATLANTTTGAAGTQIGLDRSGSINAGALTAQALRDINLNAANITTTGDASVVANRNINFGAIHTQDELNATYDDKNHLYQRQERANGTVINVGGNATFIANNDLNGQAVYVNTAKNLTAIAGGSVNIGAATQSSSYDQEIHTASSGPLSSRSTHSKDKKTSTQAIGSTLSGDSVTVQAGKGIDVIGSNVVSTTGTNLAAVENINIVASRNTANQTYSKEDKKSGVLSSGGIGVTVGSRTLENEQTGKQVSNNASTVGATQGNVHIVAGKTYTQTGSNVMTPGGDINVVAQRVDINAAHDTSDSTQDTRFQQSGLTLQITNPVISAIQSIQQLKQAAGKTRDKRMQGLAAGAAALTVANTAAQVAGSAAPAGGIDLAVSIGASSSKSHSEQHSSTAVGSTATAGGNISINATGAGKDSNLTIKGSDVTANNNLTLNADNRIDLLAEQSTNEQHSNNSSSSASLGFSVGTSGLMVNASASGSRGKGDGSDVTQANSHAKAGNQLAMSSGGDTNIKGATASGKQVTANIGGNLNVESLQDTSQYDSKQQSLGGSISVGMGKMSGSINAARSKVNGNYQSVTEQSGILAGDDGFKVAVNGNTDLKGGQIAGTDKAVQDGKNSLATQTLTSSDIQNKSDYKAESQSISAGGGYDGAKSAMNGTGVGFGKASGSASSTTKSGVSGIAGDTTVRSDKDSSGKLAKNWDGQQLQQDVEAQARITEAFGKQAALGIGTYATSKLNDLNRQIDKETDPAKKAELQGEAKNWAEGGAYRTALHAAAGALSGGLAGAAGATTSALAMPAIAEQIGKMDMPNAVKQGLSQVAAAALGAALGGSQGLASAVNVEANNRQLHQTEYDLAKKNAKVVAQKLKIGEPEAEARIIAELQRNSDKQTADASAGKHDYEIRSLVGCQLLNCNGYKNDSQYANHDYNKQYIASNQGVYDAGQTQLNRGLTDQEFRNQNIVSERIGKTVLAGTACVLAGPTACKAATTGLATTLGVNYLLDKPVTTAESLGGIYGGILSGIYGQTLAQWASGTSSFMQSATLLVTKQGSIYGGKQVGVSVGNNTSFGGSVDPLFDPATNPVWGRTNTYNYFFGDKK
ncbi:hemagglutinin repeat-containing protein [Herbaspirillum sp. RV1423]|uniref:hemagglutinin repeat-containing protein n=1 Tax=Herbaspirillum sp. RV1423 TaxID=1443993 RepID=UPI0004BB42B3|nr:hemagglutinin repeat-containing protein [Herbaspirillum sp. RV1423]